MSMEFLEQYEQHFIYLFETFQLLKPESHRRDGLRLFKQYFEIFYDEVLKVIADHQDRDKVLREIKFFIPITEFLNINISDFHDSVREESCNLLNSMTQRFLPAMVNIDQQLMTKQVMIRANIVNGLSVSMDSQLKE